MTQSSPSWARRLRAVFGIRTRLTLLFGVLLAALLLVAHLFSEHMRLSASAEADFQNAQLQARIHNEAQDAILQFRIFLLRATLFAITMPDADQSEHQQRLEQAQALVREKLSTLSTLSTHPHNEIEHLEIPVVEPLKFVSEMRQAAVQKRAKDIGARVRETNQKFNQLHERLLQSIAQTRLEETAALQRMSELHRGHVRQLGWLIGATLTVTILLTWLTLRQVIASLHQTMHKLHAIPELSSQPPVHSIGDEFDQMKQALERLRTSAQTLDQIAYVHPLTGLANSQRMNQDLETRLQQAKRFGTGVGLLFVDVNDFRAVNETIGHETGDACLREIGGRLKALAQTPDAAYHLSTDLYALHFEAPLEGLASAAIALATRAHNAVAAQIDAGGRSLHLTVSIGIALYPQHADDVRTLISTADAAVHLAKKRGLASTELADRELAARVSFNLQLATDIQRGMAANEFVPYFEPVVDINSNHVVAVEALLRWRHPQEGLLTPSRFLAVAEHTGLMYPMTSAAFREACEHFAAWPDGPALAFNVSPRQIGPELPSVLRRMLQQTGMKAERLELEIIESALIQRMDQVARILSELRDMGIRISLDDFGTGYSSLSYLQRLPVSKIKIDRSFISRIDTSRTSHAIVNSMLSIARQLNIEAVAEGVENRRQLEILRALGCRYVQGHLYAKAMSIDELRDWTRLPPDHHLHPARSGAAML